MIRKMLRDVKIGRKLSLIIYGAIIQIVCIGGLGVWALSVIHSEAQEVEQETAKMLTAHRVAEDMARVSAQVGHVALSTQCTRCHSDNSGGDSNKIVRQYQAWLNDLRSRERAPEGQKLVAELEEAGNAWRQVNTRVLSLAQTGKRAEAAVLYREESMTGFDPVDKALKAYLAWAQPRLEDLKQRSSSFTSRMLILVGALLLFAVVTGSILGAAADAQHHRASGRHREPVAGDRQGRLLQGDRRGAPHSRR